MSVDGATQQSTNKILLKKLLIHKNWADKIFMDHIGKLSENQTLNPITPFDKSIKQIMFHIYDSYWGEYHLITDQDWSDEPDFDELNMETIITKILELNDKILALIDTHDLNEPIIYSEPGYEKPIKTSVEIILSNFIEHSAYHRGQLALLIKGFGVEIIQTNYHPYNREMQQ